MNKKERAAAALMAAFPTLESYALFAANSENKEILPALIAFAAKNGLIAADAAGSGLEAFIRGQARTPEACMLPGHLTFEDFFEQKEMLLELNLSARALSDRINNLIAEHRIGLPKVSNSMLTRLKKEAADTTHKQNVIRSLAFWLGHDRGHLGPQWNYESVIRLCRGGRQQVDHREGVRIGFALYSRGDVIDHDIVGWLKRELKRYIESAIGRFAYGRWGKVRSHDITTLYVDFPKEERLSTPASYRQCLRSAVSLAHQIAIRWALCEYCSQNRFLSIGIAAGDYAVLDNYLLPVLNSRLPGDPVIRLTDFARQCVLINDIRALLCSRPSEITLFNGETLTIWWVVGLWSTLYFDFVPDLLEDRILGPDDQSALDLTHLLWSPAVSDASSAAEEGGNAISTFFRFPHNSLLGLEIAKTLYYRRRFWEAIEILKIVLSLDPTHLNARTLRMVLFRNLAIDAPSFAIAEGLFTQAYQEALIIQQTCSFQAEDFYCEYAVVYLAQAMTTLRYLRQGKGSIQGAEQSPQLIQKVLACLDQAQTLFSTGMMVSPTGIRANYLLNSVNILKAVLKSDARLFSDPDRPIDASHDTVKQPTLDYHWQIGYLRAGLSTQRPYEIIEKIYQNNIVTHDDSISLQAYRPTTYFCTAVAWWDLFPVRTVAGAKSALQMLNNAATIADVMAQKDICIYSFTRTYGEMIPAAEFIRHMQKAVRMIEYQAGGDLSARDDRELIAPGDPDRSALLMTLNF